MDGIKSRGTRGCHYSGSHGSLSAVYCIISLHLASPSYIIMQINAILHNMCICFLGKCVIYDLNHMAHKLLL